MMRRRATVLTHWLCAATCLCILAIIAGCGAPQKTTTTDASGGAADRPALRVGVARSAPPLIFGQGDEVQGIEADLARKLAEELGRPVQFVPMFFPDLIPELRAQRIDIIMAGVSVTPERARFVRFADAYMINGLQGLIRDEDANKVGSVDLIEHGQWRIGVEKDSTAANHVTRHMPGSKAVVFPTIADAVDSLAAPRSPIDLVLYDSTSVRWYAARSRDDDAAGPKLSAVQGLLTEEPIAWAVHPSDDDLHKRANEALSKWKADGTLDAILAEWLPAGK